MSWLLRHNWLWSLIAFLIGAAITWILLERRQPAASPEPQVEEPAEEKQEVLVGATIAESPPAARSESPPAARSESAPVARADPHPSHEPDPHPSSAPNRDRPYARNRHRSARSRDPSVRSRRRPARSRGPSVRCRRPSYVSSRGRCSPG